MYLTGHILKYLTDIPKYFPTENPKQTANGLGWTKQIVELDKCYYNSLLRLQQEIKEEI